MFTLFVTTANRETLNGTIWGVTLCQRGKTQFTPKLYCLAKTINYIVSLHKQSRIPHIYIYIYIYNYIHVHIHIRTYAHTYVICLLGVPTRNNRFDHTNDCLNKRPHVWTNKQHFRAEPTVLKHALSLRRVRRPAGCYTPPSPSPLSLFYSVAGWHGLLFQRLRVREGFAAGAAPAGQGQVV